jgi:hypothetical protein
MPKGSINRAYQEGFFETHYYNMVLCAEKLLPFYRYFFTYYQMNKRVTVLDFYQKIRVYDYTLFQKFVRQLNTFISKNSEKDIASLT